MMQGYGTDLEQPPRPGAGLRRWGLVLVVIAILLGLPAIAGAGWAFYQFMTQEMLARDLVPGTLAFTIDEPGEYSIFYEHQSIVAGRRITGPDTPPTFDLALRDAQGQSVDLEPFRTDYSYESPTRAGRGLYWFNAEQAGDYTLQADTNASGDFVLAVGEMRLGLMLLAVFAMFAACMLALVFGVGLVLFIVGFALRNSPPSPTAHGAAMT